MIDVQDFDALVQETYGKVYSYQQQDGCQPRGTMKFTVPQQWEAEDFEATTNPMVINGDEMGVSFKTWLETDPDTPVFGDRWDEKQGKSVFKETTEKTDQRFVWTRNFYPCVDMIIEDLYKKGLIDEGEYCLEIDW
jgi:hypothetical protein